MSQIDIFADVWDELSQVSTRRQPEHLKLALSVANILLTIILQAAYGEWEQ